MNEGQPNLGPCPICGRPLIAGASVDRHHWTPKSHGGRDQDYIHRICHRKIHSLWTEKDLRDGLNRPETIRAHPDMQGFISWVRKRPPAFYDTTRRAKSKGQS